MRAATKGDPYFSRFYDEFVHSFAEEITVKDECQSCTRCTI